MTREEFSKETASEITAGFGNKPEMLVQILHSFMDRFGFISDDAIRLLAENLNVSRADVHGVVSFYHDFRTSPAAKHVVKICEAEACQAMGSRELTAHAKATLGLDMHSSNDKFTLEPVYCLGNCACSPAMMVNDQVYGRVDKSRFDAVVRESEILP